MLISRGHSIPVVWSRKLPSTPSSVVIFKDSVGDWHASFVVSRDKTESLENQGKIGIDWGVSFTATTTDSEFDYTSSEFEKSNQTEISRYARMMDKRRAGSVRHGKAKKAHARLKRKAKNQRLDEIHKWADLVTKSHSFVAIENYKPKHLAKSRMARKAKDSAIGLTKQILINKCKSRNVSYEIVPAAYTTMTCSKCMTRAKQRLDLSQRIFKCEFCKFNLDRDKNAAFVVLKLAIAGSIDVDVEELRPAGKHAGRRSESSSSKKSETNAVALMQKENNIQAAIKALNAGSEKKEAAPAEG